MRADALASLPDVCDVLRSTRQPDGRGGQVTVWEAVATALPCRLAPAVGTADERTQGARLTAEADWTLTLAAGADAIAGGPNVNPQDRIRIGTDLYEIVGVPYRSWQLFLRLGLKSIR